MKYYKFLTPAILLASIAVAGLVAACEEHPEAPQTETLEETRVSMEAPDGEVDEPDGFEVSVLAPHAPFRDDLSAQFRLRFAGADGLGEAIVNNFRDASTMIVAEVEWEEAGSTSGWHLHPGVALVTVVEGEIEVTWDRDCVSRSYTEGDGWLDPGDIHIAEAVSNGAKAYVTFLGIPDGEPATEWVEPAEC